MPSGTYELNLRGQGGQGGQELRGEDAGRDVRAGLARAGPTRQGCGVGRTSWTLPGEDAGRDVRAGLARAGPTRRGCRVGTYELDLCWQGGQELQGEDAGRDIRAGLRRAGPTRRRCWAGRTSWTWVGRNYQARMLGGTYQMDLREQDLPGEDAGRDVRAGLVRAEPTRRGYRVGRTSWTWAGRTYQTRMSGGTYELDLRGQDLPSEEAGQDVRAGLVRAEPTRRGCRAGRTKKKTIPTCFPFLGRVHVNFLSDVCSGNMEERTANLHTPYANSINANCIVVERSLLVCYQHKRNV